MRVAIVGANGQLGTDLCDAYRAVGHDVLALTHADFDLRDAPAITRALSPGRPELVVNTAAMHNVDACQTDPDGAFAVNATGVHNLALAVHDVGSALAHISTDHVFDGAKRTPYAETDPPNPVNVYGKSKLRGEELIRETTAQHFIIRTSGLYGRAPCRAKPAGNFVQMMLRLARERGEVRVVTDEIVSPTYTQDLARQIVYLTDSKCYGVYHATCQGETSWFDYAKEIFGLAGLRVRMEPARDADLLRNTPRPKYSVLDSAALRHRGLLILPHWRDSLARYLATLQ